MMADAVRSGDRPSAADAAFIAEHGRLLRPESHPAFDPFRRPVPARQLPLGARALLAIVLVPLRLAIALLAVAAAWALTALFGPAVSERLLHEYAVAELPAWRRAVCAFATRLLGRALLFALGFWRVHGAADARFRAKDAHGATIVSNHVGVADPCVLAFVFAPAFVAKIAVARIPFVGRVGAAQHSLYIDRFDRGARSTTAAIVERQRLAADRARSVPPVCIFPEGTTTNGRHLLRFRTGAFVGGRPVAPVLLRYPYRWFSPSFEAIKAVPYLLGLMSQPWNSVYYYRLPVYFPNAQEREDPRLYADNVRRLMQEQSDFLDGEERMRMSESNFVDKQEYLSILRGRKLRKGLKLTV